MFKRVKNESYAFKQSYAIVTVDAMHQSEMNFQCVFLWVKIVCFFFDGLEIEKLLKGELNEKTVWNEMMKKHFMDEEHST